MGKKEHARLSHTFEKRFPELFDFETCGLLFIDPGDHSLYKIQDQHFEESSDEDESDGDKTPERTKEAEEPLDSRKRTHVFLRLPGDRGITGNAIKTGKVQVVHNGALDVNFAAEVDNSIGNPVLKNLLIGPLFDTDKRLRGVI